MVKKNEFVLAIKVNEKGSEVKAQGLLTSGMLKLLIGDLELVKLKLLNDLQEGQDTNQQTERYEFD